MPKWKLLPLSAGLLLALLGLIAIIRPGWAAMTLAMLLGLALLLAGIIGIAFSLTTRAISPQPLFALLQSLVCLVMGIILIFNPYATMIFVAVCFGIWTLLTGLTLVWQGILRLRQKRIWVYSLIGGAIITLFALVMLFMPLMAIQAFALVSGIYLIACGAGLAVTLYQL